MSVNEFMAKLDRLDPNKVQLGTGPSRFLANLEAMTSRNTSSNYAGTLEAAGWEFFPERPEDFTTSMEPKTFRERARERAAVTTARKGKIEFGRQGLGEEFEEFRRRDGNSVFGSETLGAVDNSMTEGALPALFDLLSMGNFAAAGAVDEYLRTDSAWEAAKQAGVEIANALPGIELEEARKKSFSETDLPRLLFGDDAADGRWTNAGIGLIMDIVLDPLTWAAGPLGVAAKTSKLGILAGKATKPVGAAARAGIDVMGDTTLGRGLSRWFIHEDHKLFRQIRDMPGIRGREDRVEIARDVLSSRDRMSDALEIADEKIFENMRRLFAHLEPQERALMGLVGQDLARTKNVVELMIEKGNMTSERAGHVMEAMAKLHGKTVTKAGKEVHVPGLIEKLWSSGRRSGFYEEDQFREFFFYGTKKNIEGESAKTVRKVMKERGIAKKEGPAGKLDEAGVIDRLEAGFDTEIDIAKIAYERTFEHAKHLQTQKFIRAIASDPRISARITTQLDDGRPIWKDAKKWTEKKSEVRKNLPGYDVFEVRRPRSYGLPGAPGKAAALKTDPPEGLVTAAFVMPKQIVTAVNNSNRLFSRPDDMANFMDTVGKYTSLWRGYATFSVGFHTRNALSMFFNNWLAGVGTHKAGAIAGRLDNPARMLKKNLQAFRLQVADQGSITSMPPWVSTALDKLGYNSIEAIPLPKVRWPKGSAKAGQVMTPTELVRHARKHGVMQVVSKMDNTPIGFERELLGISSKGAMRLDDATRAAIGSDLAVDLIEKSSVPSVAGDLAAAVGRKIKDPKILKGNRAFGSFIENNGRLALWIDRVEKGSSFADARRATTLWHYDYRKLTEIERRYLRNLIPFYAWMRFNTPRMLKAVVDDPERFSRLPKLIRSVEGMNEFKLTGAEEPDYLDEVIHAQLPAMRNGKPLFVTPDLPIGDIGNINLKDLTSSLHPLVKVFMEDVPAGGSNFFTGASLERFPGELDEDTRIGRRALHNINTMFPPLQRILRGFRAEDRDELVEFFASEFSGIRIKPIDVRRVTRGSKFHEEGLVRKFRQRIKQRVKLSKKDKEDK